MNDRVLLTNGQLRKTLSVARSLGKKNIEVISAEETHMNLTGFSKYCRKNLVYPSPLPPQDPAGTAAFAESVESLIATVARPMSLRSGAWRRWRGADCAAAAATRAVATTAAPSAVTRAERGRTARPWLREWRVASGSDSRKATRSTLARRPKRRLRRP
jgi:hypothetical protein